uniref:EF-hand domain-containing protein n=2 Tax=Astyanax mexicanus TaxID=7994 RepID=A0A8B9K0P4_ASTMX
LQINEGFDLFAAVRNRLKGHAIQTLIGLGRRLQSLDVNENGLIQKEKLRECLAEELSLSRQDSEAVWRIVGQQEEPLMDYAEMMRAVTGEMSEIRKVYVKLDPNKTGSVSLSDIEKFYSATPSQHLEVTRDVSYGEFEDYYEGLSIEVPTDQEYIDILKSTWSI